MSAVGEPLKARGGGDGSCVPTYARAGVRGKRSSRRARHASRSSGRWKRVQRRGDDLTAVDVEVGQRHPAGSGAMSLITPPQSRSSPARSARNSHLPPRRLVDAHQKSWRPAAGQHLVGESPPPVIARRRSSSARTPACAVMPRLTGRGWQRAQYRGPRHVGTGERRPVRRP